MFENRGAAGTWMGTSEVKHGSSSKDDSAELTLKTTYV